MALKITQKPSPNYTTGRSQKITKIVIHWMVGTLASTDAVFANPSSQVSAHYGIENKTIHQYVKDANTAWHAISANPYSIGIEHSAAPGRPASASTIQTSAELVASLCKKHGIPCDRAHIIKHSQVVATQCPGTIPIDTIISKANQILKGGSPVKETWKERRNYILNQDAFLVGIPSNKRVRPLRLFKKGHVVDIGAYYEINGKRFYQTKTSVKHKIMHGFGRSKLTRADLANIKSVNF